MLQGGQSKPASKPEKDKLVIDLNFSIKNLVCLFLCFVHSLLIPVSTSEETDFLCALPFFSCHKGSQAPSPGEVQAGYAYVTGTNIIARTSMPT